MSRFLYSKISIGLILIVAAVAAVILYGVYSTVEVVHEPVYERSEAELPEVSAKTWQVIDIETGEVLYRHNADEVLPIASVTKLFTAAQVIKNFDLEKEVTIEWGDVVTEGRSGKLSNGELYTGRELLFPLLLESSNDVASAFLRVHPTLLDEIALYTEGVSLSNTVIVDSAGLSNKNVSTANELGKVLRHIYFTQPEVLDITRISSYYARNNGWINNSPYIEDDSYRGGKHGFTYEANRTAAVIFEEELKEGAVRLIGYALLGSNDLKLDMNALRNFVKENTSYR